MPAVISQATPLQVLKYSHRDRSCGQEDYSSHRRDLVEGRCEVGHCAS